MNATICGHNRDVLLHVLNVAQNRNDLPSELSWFEVRDRFLSHLDRTIFDNWSLAAARTSAWFDIHDPSKLAELLTEALRERGIDVEWCGNIAAFREDSKAQYGVALSVDVGRTWQPRVSVMRHGEPGKHFTMAQARAALLLGLSLPSVATGDDAMKVFGTP